jgi:tetratricopeptide (TPR) repeat protein
MGFWNSLFGEESNPEEEKRNAEQRNFDLLKYDGVRAMRIGQFEYAAKCFEKALQTTDDPEVHDYLSQAFIHTNQLDEAQQHLSILLRAEPDNIGILLRMANVSFMQEDYDAMAEMCQQTLALDENLPAALMLLARAHIGQQRTDDAVAALTKIIDNDADMADARLLRATTLMEAGRTDEAEADTAWLMENVPEHEDVLMLKARMEHRKGNDDEALNYYDKVVDVNPFSADAFRERAAIKQQHGDQSGYEEDMKRALEIVPENTEEDIEQKMREAYQNSNPMGF